MRESRERHLLYLGLCLSLIPVLLLRDFTSSNELRYLALADEALRNHNLFAFTLNGAPYADKPPLYIWIVMACRWITGGHHVWLLGLFSLLPAVGIARVIDRWTLHEMDGEGRSMARLMLITSGLFFVSAVTIRMDMLMTLFIVLALRSFWRMATLDDDHGSRWLFPVFIFLATLSKGILGLLIPLLSVVVFLIATHHLRYIFKFWGWRTWTVLIVLGAIWLAGVYSEGGASYLRMLVDNLTIDRMFGSDAPHSQPFYYYLLTVWYCLAPWSLLVIGVVVAALRPRFVRSDIQAFFLTVSLTTFVLLSCFSSKLQIYLLPSIPFFIYGAVMFLPRFHENSLVRLSVLIPASILTLALPILIGAVAIFPEVSYLDNGLVYAAATVLSLCSGNAIYHMFSQTYHEGLIGVIRRMGWGILLAVFVASWSLPKLNKGMRSEPDAKPAPHETVDNVALSEGATARPFAELLP